MLQVQKSAKLTFKSEKNVYYEMTMTCHTNIVQAKYHFVRRAGRHLKIRVLRNCKK